MGLQLIPDDLVVPLRIAGGAIDDVEQDAGPFDMAQEGVTQPGPGTGALDETRDVGDRGPATIVQLEDAEVRLQRRKGVVGDLRPGRREGPQEGRLAGIRQAHESDIGNEPKLEADPAFLGAW